MKLDGQAFKNSDTCEGVSFAAPDAPLDIARIEINGRYPEQGFTRNLRSHEVVYVIEGAGKVTVDETETTLTIGDVVHIPPDTPFAWDGHMTLIMACDPPFEPTQYELINEAGA